MMEKMTVKICKIHGELTIEQTRKDGNKLRCKECRIETNKKSYDLNRDKRIETSTRWKEKNRERANAWERADRAKNPEKYREREKKYKKRNWAKLSVHESLRKLGLTNEQFILMNEKQQKKCAICGREERRIGRGGEIARLAIDHCHISGKIRGLLCHACNVALGSFEDNIEIIKSAIQYLEKHSQFENSE